MLWIPEYYPVLWHLTTCHYVDMYAELSFKLHTSVRRDDVMLYQAVPENSTTGRNEKTKFEELEVEPKYLTANACYC